MSGKYFRVLCCTLLAWQAGSAADSAAQESKSAKARVYFGTYGAIYQCELDVATGKLSPSEMAGEANGASFLAIHPNRKFLYAVVNSKELGGAVAAYAIDAASGKLTLLNEQSSEGKGPCHLIVDKAGKNVLVANFSDGSAGVLPIEADGRVAKMSSRVQHEGPGSRGDGPRAHSANLDAANRFAFICDMGLDKVMIYRFDADAHTLVPNDPPYAETPPKQGPRHFAFHPSGRFAYSINERGNTMTAYAYNAQRGELKPLESVNTLPSDYAGPAFTADVHVHPSGRFLYGSNRRQDSLVAFAIDQETGRLTLVGHQAAGIKEPRGFAIDPSGKYLLSANQNGGNTIVFRVDQSTGKLEPTEFETKVQSPVCVKFYPLP